MMETTVSALAAEVAALKDLFTRRLYEDKARAGLYETLQAVARQQSDQLSGAILENVIREVLLALDRLADGPPSEGLSTSVVDEILEVFARRGLTDVPADGLFDPRRHEAVGTALPGEGVTPGTVAEVRRRGFVLGEKVLRPARVTVVARPADPAATGPVMDPR